MRCEICSKIKIKTPKRRHWRRFGVFIVNFEHNSHFCFSVTIVNFKQVMPPGRVMPLKNLKYKSYIPFCRE